MQDQPSEQVQFGPVDLRRLQERAQFYAQRARAPQDIKDALAELLESGLVRRLVVLSQTDLSAPLVNDIYKYRMMKVYAEHLQAVQVDFALNVRHSPFPIARMQREDPKLLDAFLAAADGISVVQPLEPHERDVLEHYFHGFQTSEDMMQRARQHGVAPVNWQSVDGQQVAFASGTAEAASHVETTLTQLLQQYTVLAQARDIQRRTGVLLDRTERLASSLGKLAATVGTLNAHLHAGKEAVFAGRRSSDRLYLLLQNAFCAKVLHGYAGTSSVYALAHLDTALEQQGLSPVQRRETLGSLVGTHAHEVMSIFAQLLADYDDAAGSEESGPVQVSALVAHLVFIRTAGSLDAATALADTFGTSAFLAAAAAVRLPDEIAADLRASCAGEVPAGATVFDIFRVWRLDSGDYATEADHVVSAWEARCRERTAEGLEPLPKPALMHSNLSDVDDVITMSRLPERIRPHVFAFGTLADGFLPFPLPDGSEATLEMTSVVMKAVQARLPGSVPTSAPCAGKIGDGANLDKAQVDVRMAKDQQQAARERMLRMAQQTERLSGAKIAAQLSKAYNSVVKDKEFC